MIDSEPLPGFEDDNFPEPPEAPADNVSAPRRVVDNRLTPTSSTIALFWSKVVRSPSCWYWVGAISAPDGYGRINYQRGNRQRTVLAHRFAVELVHGTLGNGVVCEHKCNEPLCVRVGPGHLTPSTHSENVRYAIALGRLAGSNPFDGQGRTRYERSLAIREALRNGYDEQALLHAKTDPGPDQHTLF